jgi:RNA-splicing ligase RtcB
LEIVNLSAEPLWKLHTWIPHGLAAEKIVFLPDACPGKSPLPTGTAVMTRQPDWRRFAISDCGCGMRLVRSTLTREDVTQQRWDDLADRLRANKGHLGDLGGGNHFLDALVPHGGGPVHFLIHTGSRDESGHVDALIGEPAKFDREFDWVVHWATENREAIHEAVDRTFGRTELILDLPHNTYEVMPDGGAIIRKGSVRVQPGSLIVTPSHMSGDVVVARATQRVTQSLCSLSHGTGRTMSRADCKPLADSFDFEALRRAVVIPSGVENASL